jgi:Tol biopolymer transport system component
VQRHVPWGMKSFAWPALAIAGWVLAVGVMAKGMRSAGGTPTPVPYRFPIDLPDSVEVANGVGVKLALSRDGSQLAVAGMKEGRRALYLRHSDDIQARLAPGTDSAFNPSFSPDGEWLLFQSGSRLLKVRTTGGTPEPVLDSTIVASWGDDGSILYEKGNALWRISAAGGEARRVALPDAGRGFRRYSWPEVLPGSAHALITIWRGSNSLDSARLGTVSLRDGGVADLGIRGANAHYVAPGYLVFAQVGGSVAAVPFSLRRLATIGPATQLLQNVWTGGGGGTDFAVSDNGALAYHGGMPEAEEMTMLAVDREGNTRDLPLLGRQRFGEPRISPDGRHIAVSIGPPPPSDTGDVWIYDLVTGARSQLSARGVNIRPEWTRDGSRVVYISRQRDSQFVVSRRWDQAGETEVLARGPTPAFYEVAMGPAHGWSAVRTGLAPGGSAILIAPTESLSARRPFDAQARVAVTPKLSPNGRLIAYVATEAGRREVFLKPVTGPDLRVAVSRVGGTEPVWSPDGKTLYFRGLTNLMSVSVTERPTLAVSPPVALFADPFHRSVAHTGYDIFPNGREFLMLGGWSRAQSSVYVLVNWVRTMERRRGTPR